jgi:hypothetical protein
MEETIPIRQKNDNKKSKIIYESHPHGAGSACVVLKAGVHACSEAKH